MPRKNYDEDFKRDAVELLLNGEHDLVKAAHKANHTRGGMYVSHMDGHAVYLASGG